MSGEKEKKNRSLPTGSEPSVTALETTAVRREIKRADSLNRSR
jgi:hypothetical protein